MREYRVGDCIGYHGSHTIIEEVVDDRLYGYWFEWHRIYGDLTWTGAYEVDSHIPKEYC